MRSTFGCFAYSRRIASRSAVPLMRDPDASIRDALYLAFQARIRGVMDERYKLLEYRTEHIKLTQLFDLKNDPWEQYNLFEMLGSDEIAARMREKLFEMRDEWEDESVLFGQQYWQQWRQYEAAEVHGVAAPKGVDMAAQVNSWGTNK